MPKSTAPRRDARLHACRRYASRVCAAAFAALLLSGCGLVGGPGKQQITCPTTGMLRDGASLTRYKPNSAHDLTNVELSATIVDVSFQCQLLQGPPRIAMTLGVRIVAERGPAAPASQQQFAYIVAITTPEQQIINRQLYQLAAAFAGTARQAGYEEILTLDIPLQEEQSARDFRVYVSLQLSPEELIDNRVGR